MKERIVLPSAPITLGSAVAALTGLSLALVAGKTSGPVYFRTVAGAVATVRYGKRLFAITSAMRG
ncbi:hypothetical protein [Actinoplanes sp. NPDC049316]|uniref:hypothetical protein n=1 Tax=Actinoplanes sp. NPDC049316 TaxID=3154727 RepID=UPI003431F160